MKNKETSTGQQVIDEALELSTDLEEKEQSGLEGHKDLGYPAVKKKRVYKQKKYDSSSVRRSIRLKLNQNNGKR